MKHLFVAQLGVGGARARARARASPLFHHATGQPRAGINAHLTPTKKNRRVNGTLSNRHAKQWYCKECKRKTKYMCSECWDMSDAGEGKEIWLCHTQLGRSCFAKHMDSSHDM